MSSGCDLGVRYSVTCTGGTAPRKKSLWEAGGEQMPVGLGWSYGGGRGGWASVHRQPHRSHLTSEVLLGCGHATVLALAAAVFLSSSGAERSQQRLNGRKA